MKKLALGVLSLLVLVTISALATDGNLILSGSFEYSTDGFDIDAPDGDYTWKETNFVGGWAVENTFPSEAEYDPRLEVWDNLRGSAADGTQFVELDGYDPTTISQEPTTRAGYCHELSYAWSPRPHVADNQMKVHVDDTEVAHHSASGVGQPSVSWTYETYKFAAADTATKIAFAEVGPDDQLGMLLDAISLMECAPVSVGIDIKPGGYPNCVNINGRGAIPVAILGSADFDVTQIDVSTLIFAGLEVRVRRNGTFQCAVADFSGDFTSPRGAPDGFDDLGCKFVDDAEAWTVEAGTATLTGYFDAGYGLVALTGTDEICLRPAR
jgi:hypothetical protein